MTKTHLTQRKSKARPPYGKKKVDKLDLKEKFLAESARKMEFEGLSFKKIFNELKQKPEFSDYHYNTCKVWFRRFSKQNERGNGLEKSHLNMLFTFEEEAVLVSAVLSFANVGVPLSKARLLDVVRKVFPEKVANQSLDGWFKRFLGRHQHILDWKPVKGLSHKSFGQDIKQNVLSFIEAAKPMLSYYTKNPEKRDLLLNCDEIPVSNKDFWQGSKFLVSRTNVKKTKQTPSKPSRAITFLPFYSAAGHMVCSVWIIGLGKKGQIIKKSKF